VTGTLPSGLGLDTGTGLISGTPSLSGTFNVTINASNAGGSGSTLLTISISNPIILIGNAVDAASYTWTTGGDANWQGETTTTYDNVDAAQSGDVSDNQLSWVQTSVTGPASLSFRWKVDSEQGYDYLNFK